MAPKGVVYSCAAVQTRRLPFCQDKYTIKGGECRILPLKWAYMIGHTEIPISKRTMTMLPLQRCYAGKNTADEDNVEKPHRLNNLSSVSYKQEGIAEEQKELRRTGQAVILLQTHSLLSYLAPEYNCPQILPSHHTRSD